MTSPAVSPTDTTPGKPLSETTDAKPASTKAKLGSLRALWPFVRQHSALFSAWLIALAVASAATLSLPWAFGRMIDDGFSSGSNIDRAFLLKGQAQQYATAQGGKVYDFSDATTQAVAVR